MKFMALDSDSIRVTLVRNKSTKAILYMEAGKDFVDLLFSFLTLPTGTVLRILAAAEFQPLGAISNLLESVRNLDGKILYVDKSALLDQKPQFPATSPQLLKHVLEISIEPAKPWPAAGSTTSTTVAQPPVYYRCACAAVLTLVPEYCRCTACNHSTTTAVTVVVKDGFNFFVNPTATASVAGGAGKPGRVGFVKKSLTYSITDDLQVLPSPSITTGVELLSKLKVESLSDLDIFEATVGSKEALLLLQSSLSTKSALNNVFGPNSSFAN